MLDCGEKRVDDDQQRTTVESSHTFLPHNTLQACGHALTTLTGCHVSTGLDGDVWVGDAGSSKLAQSSKQEAVPGGHLSALLQHLLQLLEDSVLKDGVDHQDQSGQHAGEEACRAILADDLEEG